MDLTSKNYTIHTNIKIKFVKKVGICLDNKQVNFHLYRFTNSENIAKSFRGDYFFDSH